MAFFREGFLEMNKLIGTSVRWFELRGNAFGDTHLILGNIVRYYASKRGKFEGKMNVTGCTVNDLGKKVILIIFSC
jgi:hypothetical protein